MTSPRTPPAAVTDIEVAALPELQVVDPREDPATLAITTALGAAAREAAATARRLRGVVERDMLKKRVDGAATDAAEAVLAESALTIHVVAGEGQRDSSPGATVGQIIGGAPGAAFDGVFDYVDGTSLAAAGLPGALSLGGLGRGLREVPDLQAFSVLARHDVLERVDVMADPEESIAGWLAAIADTLGTSIPELTIATHSTTSSRSHLTLIERMRRSGAHVVVPEPVTIEPPFLLSLLGLAEPAIDAFIGVIGLSEIAFAALLLDLALPEHRLAFRLASIDGARAVDHDRLTAHFRFSPKELAEYVEAGWEVDVAHSAREIVPSGAGHCAALFAVTQNDILGLHPPIADADRVAVEGVVLAAGSRVARVRITFLDQPWSH